MSNNRQTAAPIASFPLHLFRTNTAAWAVLALGFAGAPAASAAASPNAPLVADRMVSIATAGQNGWDCGTPAHHRYCADASLRYDKDRQYATLATYMTYARELQQIFLIVHQFNEYVMPDEGWNANTIDDTDATNLWGYSAIRAVQEEIKKYREAVGGSE
jgi:hypothetical protein